MTARSQQPPQEASHETCWSCGYVLYQLGGDARCPECGLQVEASRARWRVLSEHMPHVITRAGLAAWWFIAVLIAQVTVNDRLFFLALVVVAVIGYRLLTTLQFLVDQMSSPGTRFGWIGVLGIGLSLSGIVVLVASRGMPSFAWSHTEVSYLAGVGIAGCCVMALFAQAAFLRRRKVLAAACGMVSIAWLGLFLAEVVFPGSATARGPHMLIAVGQRIVCILAAVLVVSMRSRLRMGTSLSEDNDAGTTADSTSSATR